MASVLTETPIPDAAEPESGPRSRRGDPPWELARLFPCQGEWTEEEYLALDTNHLVEFSDGEVEFRPMPNLMHHLLSQFLFERLKSHSAARKPGMTLYAPYQVRLRRGLLREPDVLFLRKGRAIQQQFVEGADLVIEVASPGADGRTRDLVNKRTD